MEYVLSHKEKCNFFYDFFYKDWRWELHHTGLWDSDKKTLKKLSDEMPESEIIEVADYFFLGDEVHVQMENGRTYVSFDFWS